MSDETAAIKFIRNISFNDNHLTTTIELENRIECSRK